jgi:hypothetical protein
MEADYRLVFRPDIPVLALYSISFEGKKETIRWNKIKGPLKIPVHSAGDGKAACTIRFNLSFSEEARRAAPFRISLEPWLPRGLPLPRIKTLSWLGNDSLRIEWLGLEAGKNGEQCFYRLKIPGGRSGIVSGTGPDAPWLPEDHILFLEAVE